jgi:tetratricopeptide (TPR) repeat protein
MHAMTVAAVLGGVSPAAAQEGTDVTDNRDAEARGLFDAGRAAYSDGRFDEALTYFSRAHDLSGRAEMLYNIGAAAERAGESGRAIEAFEAYLSEVPEASNRGEVEARIRTLRERERVEVEGTSGGEAAGETVEPPPAGGGPGALPWILVAAGGAMTIGGAVLFVIGNSAIDRVADAPVGAMWSEYEGDHDRGPTQANLGLALAGVGVAAAVTGVVLLASSGDDGETHVAVGPSGVAVRGRF